MEPGTFTVHTQIDAPTFRAFAVFDSLRLRKRWRAPVLFALILLISAAVCFSLRQRADQAAMLAVVLTVVGVGLPAAYFLSFFLSVGKQIKNLGLKQAPMEAYTVSMDEQGVEVSTEKQKASLRWNQVFGIYRVKGCIYLYATAERAYLLPDGQAEGGAGALWAFLTRHMPANRTTDFCR